MATQDPASSGINKWQDSINRAIGDAKWNVYDCDIQVAVNEINRHLSGTTGYRLLDWQLIKAMVWVESGAGSAAWKTRPMQIGVPGDPGLASLLSGKEGSDLILPPAWKAQLTVASVRTTPAVLKKLNPTANVLRPGQVLKYQKAAVQRVIVGWQVITSALIQRRYNGDGDPKYAEKLDYVLRVLRTAKVAPCTP